MAAQAPHPPPPARSQPVGADENGLEAGPDINTTRSVVKAFRILELFGHSQPVLTLGDVVRNTGFNRSTAYRMCSTLVDLGYLTRDDKNYRLGIKAVALAHAAAASQELPDLAMPALKELREKTGETINLAVQEGTEVVYLARLRSRHILGIQLSVGSRIPIHASSLGKAIVAYLPADEREEVLNAIQFDQMTLTTINSIEGYREEIAEVQKNGYALNLEELAPGIRGIAQPIFDHTGYPVAALNIAITRHLTAEEIVGQLHDPLNTAAVDISAALGNPSYTPRLPSRP